MNRNPDQTCANIEGGFYYMDVQDVEKGEYVRRVDKKGNMMKATYQRGEYDRATKRYSLVDCDDMNREVFVKRGTTLALGFTY